MSPRSVPIFLSHGFRLFFLAAPAYAALAVVYWVLVLAAGLSVPPLLAPSVWHGHEMLYGFGVAAIGGFFLTAAPNWTAGTPLRGMPLAVLFGIWIAGRAAVWGTAIVPAWLVAVVDLAFLPGLLVAIFVPLVAKGLRRQLVFAPIVIVLWLGDVLLWAGVLGVSAVDPSWCLRLGIYAVVVLITVMGGRVIPSFTANYLKRRDESDPIVPAAALDKAVILATVAVLGLGLAGVAGVVAGTLFAALAVLHAARMSRWQGMATLGEPILWALHAGYAWLVIGFALIAAVAFGAPIAPDAPLHALTIGGMGGLMLAVMSRATLGHTGRPIAAAVPVVAAYVLLHAAAVVRVFGPMVVPHLYLEDIAVAGALWAIAFALFAVWAIPIMMRPRIDGRPG
ncbi:MAG: NnrS family protein [Alphaproteobacteria bacterium]|nr:NnrS family protein [Alphaproteobacteria bacterium]